MSKVLPVACLAGALLALGISVKDANLSTSTKRVVVAAPTARVWAGASCAVTAKNGSKGAAYFCTIWGAAESIALGIVCPPAGIISAV